MEKKDNRTSVELRLLKIQETSFFIDSTELSSIENVIDKNFNIEFGLRVEFNIETNNFVLHFMVKYIHGGIKILELITANHFEINNLKELIVLEDKKFKDTKGIMPMLVNIAIGTIRGILIVKTAGNILSDFPLPIVNSQEVCKVLLK